MKQIIFSIILLSIILIGCTTDVIVVDKDAPSKTDDSRADSAELQSNDTGSTPKTIPKPEPKPDTEPESTSSGCSLVGTWKQTKCAYSDGTDLDCIIPLSNYARILTFNSDNTVKFSCTGADPYCTGPDPTTRYVKGDAICQDIGETTMCFSIKKLGCNALLYCLTTPQMVDQYQAACEYLVRS
ncbi:MAG: hypothetical protein KAK00_02215 [Nanoarchaeota archaeon]|nr:hypothetical protein [Nanoarchaeota archaeon]